MHALTDKNLQLAPFEPSVPPQKALFSKIKHKKI
jgi:hypothetical protein